MRSKSRWHQEWPPCSTTGVIMWEGPFSHPCFQSPETQGARPWDRTLWASLYCSDDWPWAGWQAPKNVAWQATQTRSLNLALAPVRWGWGSLKAFLCMYVPLFPNWLGHLKLKPFPKLWEWKGLVCIASWNNAEAGDMEGSWWMFHPDFWKQDSLSSQVGLWQQIDQRKPLALSKYKCTEKQTKPWIFRISKLKERAEVCSD